jgi:F-type H+-transporting ATPase subunit epsilon|tara:strand:- start:221 stop:475 length:255 start_codon:yes stop_codon:yes gene_type:complete
MVTMKLEIITPESIIYSGDVESVIAPGMEGELGILPHHAALMTSLKCGDITVTVDGTNNRYPVSGGFLEVIDNKVTILADSPEN